VYSITMKQQSLATTSSRMGSQWRGMDDSPLARGSTLEAQREVMMKGRPGTQLKLITESIVSG